jgi:type I restriction enzyme M protein
MDLRRWTENPVKGEQKKKVQLITDQIQRVADLYHQWQSVGTDGKDFAEPEFYRSVGIEEIEQNNWTLVPSKYIEFIDHDLEIDYPKEMARIQKEMRELMAREKESQRMLEEAFKGIGYGIE